MDLKSIFHRDKGSNLSGLPHPPSIREMIEDIESSPKNDPVILFANFLQKKGNRKSSLNGLDVDVNMSEVMSSPAVTSALRNRKRSESGVSSPSSESQSSQFSEVPEKSGVFAESLSDSLDPTESVYTKLKQFITLSEQTQEITLDIETKIKDFERDNREFLNILGVKQESK